MNKHFVIVGAQRSGTSYLYKLLDSYAEIDMAKPVRPEPKFFLRDDLQTLSYADYLALHFDSASQPLIRGEKTTSYIEYEHAAQAIARWLPEAKIIICLREPISRAISNYYFTKNHGLESLSIEEAFRQEDKRLDNYDPKKISTSPYAYLKRGHYMDYIDVYRRYFQDDAIRVLVYEEFVANAPALLDLLRWLGLSNEIIPQSLNDAVNPSNKESDDSLPQDLRAELQAAYKPSIARLEAYLGREIKAWREEQ